MLAGARARSAVMSRYSEYSLAALFYPCADCGLADGIKKSSLKPAPTPRLSGVTSHSELSSTESGRGFLDDSVNCLTYVWAFSSRSAERRVSRKSKGSAGVQLGMVPCRAVTKPARSGC